MVNIEVLRGRINNFVAELEKGKEKRSITVDQVNLLRDDIVNLAYQERIQLRSELHALNAALETAATQYNLMTEDIGQSLADLREKVLAGAPGPVETALADGGAWVGEQAGQTLDSGQAIIQRELAEVTQKKGLGQRMREDGPRYLAGILLGMGAYKVAKGLLSLGKAPPEDPKTPEGLLHKFFVRYPLRAIGVVATILGAGVLVNFVGKHSKDRLQELDDSSPSDRPPPTDNLPS